MSSTMKKQKNEKLRLKNIPELSEIDGGYSVNAKSRYGNEIVKDISIIIR